MATATYKSATIGGPPRRYRTVAGTSGARDEIMSVSPNMNLVVGSTITRPADTTAYASGDLVANSTTAGSVVATTFVAGEPASGGTVRVKRLKLAKTNTVLTNASFRLHLYTVVPTVTNGDNGAWLSTGFATYLGSIDVTVDKAMSDGATGWSAEVYIQGVAVVQTLYGLLECRGAYTPTSAEVFTLTLEVEQG